MQFQSLAWEDPLEKEMTIHSSILAWGNPMDRETWQAVVHRVTNSWTLLKRLSMHARSFLYGSTLTSIHDHRKNHSFDYTDFCLQIEVSAF